MSVLTECPESRNFANWRLRLGIDAARKEVLQIVARLNYPVLEPVDSEGSQEATSSASSDEEEEDKSPQALKVSRSMTFGRMSGRLDVYQPQLQPEILLDVPMDFN